MSVNNKHHENRFNKNLPHGNIQQAFKVGRVRFRGNYYILLVFTVYKTLHFALLGRPVFGGYTVHRLNLPH